MEKRVTNHTLLALNPKTQFGLLDPNDNVLDEIIGKTQPGPIG